MEVIKFCPLCGSSKFDTYIIAADYLVSGENFYVVRCVKCSFLFTNPRPSKEKISHYYHSVNYISHVNRNASLFEKAYSAIQRCMVSYKLRLILKYLWNRAKAPINNPSLLDYGCGSGHFLSEAVKKGFIGMGFEPNDNAARISQDLGLDVKLNDDFLYNESFNNKFDVITLWHVLEHIPDFMEKLKSLKLKLKPNGLLVVAIPEYQSFDSKFYKNDWAAWDLPRHLNHFDCESVKQLCAINSLRVFSKTALPFDSFYVSLLTEMNRKSSFLGLLRGFSVGLLSNFLSFIGHYPYSSQIYFICKTDE